MKAVLQRVEKASVLIKQTGCIRSVRKGLVILLGIGRDDRDEDVLWMAEKISRLRIFDDEQGRLNLSVQDIKGEILIISQFTLYGNCRRGRRPDFTRAASPEEALPLYGKFVSEMRKKGLKVEIEDLPHTKG